MKSIAVDDEYHALKVLERAIGEAAPEGELAAFQDPAEALKYAVDHPIDIAFLDVEMRAMNGLELAKKLKNINGEMNIIFITGYREYAIDAFEMRASGYVCKPVSAADICKELQNLRFPSVNENRRVKIRCFGNFDILVDGNSVVFSRSKAKEILAYLVDRGGAGTSIKELAGIIWEEGLYTRSRQQQIQTYISTLLSDLKKVEADSIIIRKRNYLALDKSEVDCDLYRYLEGDSDLVNAYRGEYMTNYSWGEFTVARLQSFRPKN